MYEAAQELADKLGVPNGYGELILNDKEYNIKDVEGIDWDGEDSVQGYYDAEELEVFFDDGTIEVVRRVDLDARTENLLDEFIDPM